MIKTTKMSAGITLVEAMAVIGIGAAISAGAIVMYQNAQTSQATKKETDNMAALFTKLSNYTNGESTAGLTETVAIRAGSVPKGMVNGTTVRHSFAGTTDNRVYIRQSGGNGFYVDYRQVPQENCAEFVKNIKSLGWTSLYVRNRAFPPSSWTPTNIANYCTATTNRVIGYLTK